MPSSHRKHLEWSPTRMIRWGETIGPHTARFIESLLENRPHPEQGYRSCLGTLRLEKHYGAERLEIACARALAVRARSYRHVHNILKKGLDRLALCVEPEPSTATSAGQQALPLHDNLRGRTYYGDDTES